jgi:hypothetical protein
MESPFIRPLSTCIVILESKDKKIESSRQAQVYDTKNEGYYWNEHIKPKADAYQIFKYDNSKAEELLKAGFGVVNTHPRWYCARYRSFGCLNNEDQGIRLLANQISNHFSFSRRFNQASQFTNGNDGLASSNVFRP